MSDQDDIKHSDTFIDTSRGNEEILSPSTDKHMSDSPLDGIRTGAVVRPEPLFHRKTRLIIDTHYSPEHNVLRNGLEETEFQHINLISLDKLFDNKHEIFLGFGLPNVYLTIPNEQYNGYVKFAAYMLWRQVSAVLDTKGRVQSGFLIRFRNLPQDAIEMLRRSMRDYSNKRHVSCAYGNACVLNSASFTSSGTDLRNHFGARALFQQIYENGLEFQGQPLTLDFIRTTRLTLEEHFHQVRKKELTSLGRTCEKVFNECLSSNNQIRAPLLEARDVSMKPTVVETTNSLARLQISRPRMLGAIIRKVWGSHTLFRVIPNRKQIDVNNYLPNTLQAFPVKDPTFITRVKKYVLFSRPVVMTIRRQLAALWDDHGEFSPAPLASMMSIHTKKEPHPYNIVITGNYLIGMHYNLVLDLKVVNWVLSKHVLISGYDDDVRFAGEAWMEHQEDGVALHLTNNSGTYLPNNEHLAAAGRFISAAFPGLKLELHENLSPLPSLSDPIDDQPTMFTFKNILILVLALMFWLCFVIFGHFN
jgi:hypothetical protein